MNAETAKTRIPPVVRLKALFAVFLVFVLFAFAAGVASIAYLAMKAQEQSARNTVLLKAVKQTNDRLVDCTTPGGKCYDEGQKNTGKAIVGINEGTMQVIIAALSCQADGITEQRELLRCTTQRAR